MKKYKVMLWIAGILFIAAGAAMMMDKKIAAYVLFLPAALCLVIGRKLSAKEEEKAEREDAP